MYTAIILGGGEGYIQQIGESGAGFVQSNQHILSGETQDLIKQSQ